MLHEREKRLLYWIIPIWIIGCIVVATWFTFRETTGNLRNEIFNTQPETDLPAQKNKEVPSYVTKPAFSTYIEITGDCGPSLAEACQQAHVTTSSTSTVVAMLRSGIVLEVEDVLQTNEGVWYKVVFNEWIRYPERVSKGFYVLDSGQVRFFIDEGTILLDKDEQIETNKQIIVDRSDQMLYAYENGEIVLTQSISTGIRSTPTPRGTFTVYKKTPSRYMQGPLPGISSDYYDLPGVPWNLYFTEQGGVIHGAYWHDQFGKPWSHGCVNVPQGSAEKLYRWADIGTPVFVRD